MTDQNIAPQATPQDDCVSKRPWSEVLNRSAKMLTFQAAREGGKSLGKLVFLGVLAFVVILLLGWIVNTVTGWFDGWLNCWPFGSDVGASTSESGWFGGSDGSQETQSRSWFGGAAAAPAEVESDQKWYCKWHPVC